MTIRKQLKWFLPLTIFLILAPWTPRIDLTVSSFFFSPSLPGFSKAFYHKLIYKYAVMPALFVAISAALLFVASFKVKKLFKWRWPCFFCALSMVIGAGFVTHCLFKEFWFRPRPVQTTFFGGPLAFRPFYLPKFNFPNFCKSFPSGHATMGFYFLNLILLGIRLKNRFVMHIGIWMTAIMSTLLCFSRIAQGAHFFSDTFMSLIVTWYAALLAEKVTFEYVAKHEKFSLLQKPNS